MIICFGTRPEWLKIKPLLDILDKSKYKLLFTGQHLDLIENLEVEYQIQIEEGTNRLDDIIASCLKQFPTTQEKSILVQGDTASALACALAGFHRGMKIYYLEAGLRSNDLNHPYPEEGYRQMISRIANVNFAPTRVSYDNLIADRVLGKTYITGNTVLDNLVPYKDRCSYQNKVLITLHRRENHESIAEWFRVFDSLAKKHSNVEFILPIHPNPKVQEHRHLLKHVQVIEPLEHKDLLELLIQCKLVITDSGGLQEEGSFLNKKVIVCREVTERPEAIGTGHLYLTNVKKLQQLFGGLIEDFYIKEACPYGDGASAKIILNLLERENY